ncbi:unnamed protein product [Camellia sinensis]
MLGLSSLQKITAALKMLAYGVAADFMDEYLRIGESTAMKSLKKFVKAVCLIPEEIGELRNMRRLSLSVNNFMGPIPTSIFNISSLEILSLAANQLLANLPSNTGLWLPNLNTLYLGGNKLSGVIPDSISNASKVITLDLSENAFMGLIPKALGNLQLLEFLNLAKNNLRSSPELSFVTSFANCKQLKELGISFNPLNGILPTTIGNLSASLENIYADSCGIKSNIPSEIGNLIKVLGKLQILYLSNNRLQGSIPDDLCHFKNMGDLRLNHNELSGLIPECLGNITSLRYLYLDFNKLSSSIPTSLRNLKDILEINMSTNSLNGNLPLELGNLKVAILIDLSMNQFIGEIPSTITGLQNLVNLSLAYNRLQGPIPDSFGNMVSLEFLDLSHNNLSGVIPKSLETLSHLSYLNVSFNKLRGQIPIGGPFANFTIQSFMSNEALCGAPKFQAPPCHIGSPNHLRKKKSGSSFISRKRNKTPANFDLLPTTTPPRITYQQLFQATNGFSESNLLGMGSFGSVYKAILKDATILAIKVFNLEVEAAFKSFDIECEIMRSIHHRNLVKVISNCSNLDFKALVFEYMPNGSLEKWLYSYNYFLDMLQRLDIMIDVACALEYLHHGYSTSLVHCDLKPRNILLDKDMVAHVSDFGIAKLLDLGESVIHTKTIATFGYIAPGMDSSGDPFLTNLLQEGSNFDNQFMKSQYLNQVSQEEDNLLISAWLNTSLDAVHGNEQKSKTFWRRVGEYFHEYKTFISECTDNSLMNRWSIIQLGTNKFCGHFAQIESMRESGVNEQDNVSIT